MCEGSQNLENITITICHIWYSVGIFNQFSIVHATGMLWEWFCLATGTSRENGFILQYANVDQKFQRISSQTIKEVHSIEKSWVWTYSRGGTGTRSLLIKSQTRYHCATQDGVFSLLLKLKLKQLRRRSPHDFGMPREYTDAIGY